MKHRVTVTSQPDAVSDANIDLILTTHTSLSCVLQDGEFSHSSSLRSASGLCTSIPTPLLAKGRGKAVPARLVKTENLCLPSTSREAPRSSIGPTPSQTDHDDWLLPSYITRKTPDLELSLLVRRHGEIHREIRNMTTQRKMRTLKYGQQRLEIFLCVITKKINHKRQENSSVLLQHRRCIEYRLVCAKVCVKQTVNMCGSCFRLHTVLAVHVHKERVPGIFELI